LIGHDETGFPRVHTGVRDRADIPLRHGSGKSLIRPLPPGKSGSIVRREEINTRSVSRENSTGCPFRAPFSVADDPNQVDRNRTSKFRRNTEKHQMAPNQYDPEDQSQADAQRRERMGSESKTPKIKAASANSVLNPA
jgi:hypothetical protein